MERCRRIAGCLVSVLALAACGGGGGGRSARFAFAFPLDAPPATAMTVVRAFPRLGFFRPLFATHPPDGSDRIFVVERQFFAQRFPGHGPVHRAGVEVLVIKAARNLARHRTFSGARRAVDRDDETTRGHVRQYIRAIQGL